MIIGCTKEIKTHEYRVGLTPSNVYDYVKNGHRVLIERGAGEGASLSDEEYKAAGAEIINNADDIWQTADMIIKVKEPLPSEYEKFKEDQLLYTFLHLAADKPLTEALIKKRVRAVAYETITDKTGGFPLLKPMSEVAGRLSIQQAAKYLEKPKGGRGVLLSGIPGTKRGKVTVIGAGSVGLSAAVIAVGMGAEVSILDINIDRLTYIDDIYGNKIQTLMSSAGNIAEELKTADAVIGSVYIAGSAAPKLIRKEHLSTMKPGSVLVDVAIDQGGCAETSRVTYHDDPVYVVDGVTHYCVANMPGAVPRTSTIGLTNATLRQGLSIANKGLEQAAKDDIHLKNGINAYNGYITYTSVADEFGLEYKNFEEVMR
ncbi:MAG: alanine dehydrogenase [Defluviitaleaceae bacterium]|nr:alanine dehydrogenase [Defluviitaleaceae bacterium]